MRANHERHLAFGRLVSSAVGSQALLSGGNFIVGLVLLRSTSDAQYGYYILATSALLLAVSLQNAFFNPPLARRLPGLDSPATTALIAALKSGQVAFAGLDVPRSALVNNIRDGVEFAAKIGFPVIVRPSFVTF